MNDEDRLYLPKEAQVLKVNEQIESQFSKTNFIVGLFRTQNVLNLDFLKKIKSFDQSLESSNMWSDVNSVTTQEHIEAGDEGLTTSTLLDIESFPSKPLDYWKKRVRSDPFGIGLSVSEDFMSTLVIARPQNGETTDDLFAARKDFENKVSQAGLSQEFIGTVGSVTNRNYQQSIVIQDNLVLVPLILVIGFLVTFFLFKRFSYVLLLVSTTVMALLVSESLLVIFGFPMTSVSSILGPLVTTLFTALMVHIFSGLDKESGSNLKVEDQVRQILLKILRPSFYIILTTSIGLGSMIVSQIPSIRHFSIVSSLGLLIGYFLTILLIPALLVFAKKNQKSGQSFGFNRLLTLSLYLTNRFALRRSLLIVTSYCFLIFLSAFYLKDLQADTNYHRFFKDSHPIHAHVKSMEQNFFGTSELSVVFEAEEIDSFKKASFLKKIRIFKSRMMADPGVDQVITMSDHIDQMHLAFLSDDESLRSLSDELISQYLFIYDGTALYDFVNRDFNTSQIIIYNRYYGTSDLSQFVQAIDKTLTELKLGQSIRWKFGGSSMILKEQDKFLIESQRSGLLIAALLIFMILLFFTKDLKSAVICFIPNALAPFLLLGLMGFFKIFLDIGTVLIGTVILGIAVDDTLHYFSEFKRHRLKGRSKLYSISKSSINTGRAMAATSFVLTIQFSSMLLSQFIPSFNFGLLGALGIIFALILDLTLLPSLLNLFMKDK